MTASGKPWFAPKRYGYGSVPVTWEGWAALAGFVALLVAGKGALVWLLPKSPLRHGLGIAVPVALAIGFVILVRAKTEGGMRWRWGDAERKDS